MTELDATSHDSGRFDSAPPPRDLQPPSKSISPPDFQLSKTQDFESSTHARARSSLRQRYEAEAKVIERRLGGLEKIRMDLGLTQRKMAQLLMVDPSAWTRWTQGETTPPPHIWRSLSWYLALQDKYPALDVTFWLQGVARTADADRISQNADEIRTSRLQVQSLEKKVFELSREIESLRTNGPLDGPERRARSETIEDRHAKQVNEPPNEAGQDKLREQAETRTIANIFLILTLLALGYAMSLLFS
jgi:transcriptional regulator with XRE-family HTH domain